MDGSQWTQGIEVVANSGPSVIEKKQRPPRDEVLNCPRCNSINTKFCYYNNYSLSQPRYFCKTCRRYWTNGGSLRNVPVGGGSKKNRRSSSSSSKNAAQNIISPQEFSPQNPKIQEGQTLNLSFNPSTSFNTLNTPQLVGFPIYLNTPQNPNNSYSEGFIASFVNDSMPMADGSNSVIHSSGLFSTHEFKPCLNFSSDCVENRNGNSQGVQDHDHTSSSKIVLPFEDLKASEGLDQERDEGQGIGYIPWNGMLGGGGPW